jgi:mannose-6-phosphate isomerase-like protein (cupin superfamily)
MDVRRVVTGNNTEGDSCVLIDDVASNATSRRAGHDSRLIWHTDSAPAKYSGDTDEAEPHFTETVDYVIVISGEMDMVLDTGSVTLRAGDVLVQRGTRHNWVNRGTEPCRFAAILIDGEA